MSNPANPCISPFSLTMLMVIAIASLRDVPQIATYGLGAITVYIMAGVLFFIPVAMITAELVSTWPEAGGSYFWIKKAFGQHVGFVCLILYWFQNVLWYPVITTYAASSFAYFWDPAHAEALVNSPSYISCFIIVAQWAQTLMVLLGGLEVMAFIGSFSSILGFFTPALVLIITTMAWIYTGMPSHLSLQWSSLIPPLHQAGSLTFAVTVILAFMGIEMTCAHVQDVRGGYKGFVLSIAVACISIMLVFILCALAIAVVFPSNSIVLQSGVVASLEKILAHFGLEFLSRYISLCMTIGVIGSVSAWLTGPSRQMSIAAKEGILPAVFSYQRHGIASAVVLLNSTIVSVVALVFYLQPSVTQTYFTLSDCAVQLYLIVYVAMISAAVVLRLRHPEKISAFQIPGGMLGLGTTAAIALFGCTITFLVGFIPPSQFALASPDHFSFFLAGMIFLICALASALYLLRRAYGCVTTE